MAEQEYTQEQLDKAWMAVSASGQVVKFDIEKARRMANDPNPHISMNVKVMLSFLDLAARIVETADIHVPGGQTYVADRIRNLMVVDGDPVPPPKITGWIAMKHKSNGFGEWSISPKAFFEEHGKIPDCHANLIVAGMEEVSDHTLVTRDGSDGRQLLTDAGFEIDNNPAWYYNRAL